MKRLTRNLATALIALPLALTMTACGDDDSGGPVAATGVTIKPADMILTKDGPYGAITAAVAPAGAANRKMEWSWEPKGFVNVTPADGGAIVAPVAATDESGPVTVTVTTDDGGFTDTCAVTVVAVTGVTLDPDAMSLAVGGDVGTLNALVLPEGASQGVEWSSHPEGVVDVAGTGGTGAAATVAPLEQGTATVIARSAVDRAKTATCTVTVTPRPAQLTVAPPTMTQVPNGTGTLTASVLPAGAAQAVVWTSDNKSVATVVGEGPSATVTAVAIGAARIKAAAAGFPDVSGFCDVTVAAGPPIAPTTFAAGLFHSLGIREGGDLWAWGDNYFGQLGDGTTAVRLTPAQLPDDAGGWVSVSAGNHTMALRADGSLWAWGRNTYGQLGDGTNAQRYFPIQVGGAGVWAAVSAGEVHTMAIKKDGSLWAWGENYYGQLGDGTTEDRNSPVQVGVGDEWIAAAAGYNHTLAIKKDGSIWAWGWNVHGQLGDGTTEDRSHPVRVGGGNDWIAATAGGSHTMALKADGGLWAWGENYYGQLGDGTNTDHHVPVQVGGGGEWLAVSAGYSHTMAIKKDGSLWAWGYNEFGRLGDGTTANKNAPVHVGEGDGWIAVAAGYRHTLALSGDGDVWAWGANAYGAVGDGTTTNRHSPVHVGGGYRVPASHEAARP